jgi:hypothetical protein
MSRMTRDKVEPKGKFENRNNHFNHLWMKFTFKKIMDEIEPQKQYYIWVLKHHFKKFRMKLSEMVKIKDKNNYIL